MSKQAKILSCYITMIQHKIKTKVLFRCFIGGTPRSKSVAGVATTLRSDRLTHILVKDQWADGVGMIT